MTKKNSGVFDARGAARAGVERAMVTAQADKFTPRPCGSRAEFVATRDAAKALAKNERWMDAYVHFTMCLTDREHASAEEDDLPLALLNRSLMALKLGDYGGAKADAKGAVEVLRACEALGACDEEQRVRRGKMMVKALYRIGAACLGKDDVAGAIESLLDARERAPNDVDVREKLLECAARARMTTVCEAYADAISEGESPNVVSPRDGKWLKPVRPEAARLSRNAMAQMLADCAVGVEAAWRREFGEMFLLATGVKKELSAMRRGFLSGIRAEVYAHAGNHEQAVKDYRVALAYYPEWARAYYGYALAIEQQLIRDNVTRVQIASFTARGMYNDALIVDAQVAAALWMKRALELDGSIVEYGREYLRLVAKVSNELRDVLSRDETGVRDALEWLDNDKWENAPEYVRPRPKYYYFYEMMKQRIYEHYPELPQPVMDKLLSLDAGELDLLLQYPRAIKGQTEEFLDVYKREGGAYLETYKTPTLSWEEVKALKGAGTQGLLPDGGRAAFAATDEERVDPGSGFIEENDTDHAALGASGEDGLTRAELAGLPTPPSLPPDQLRERTARLALGARPLALPSQTDQPSKTTTRRIDAVLSNEADVTP